MSSALKLIRVLQTISSPFSAEIHAPVVTYKENTPPFMDGPWSLSFTGFWTGVIDTMLREALWLSGWRARHDQLTVPSSMQLVGMGTQFFSEMEKEKKVRKGSSIMSQLIHCWYTSWKSSWSSEAIASWMTYWTMDRGDWFKTQFATLSLVLDPCVK